jgi:hypothetical protein
MLMMSASTRMRIQWTSGILGYSRTIAAGIDMGPALVVQLKGGLGNQLFQYAAGAALARASGATLALDDRTGFARDRRFKRTYELEPLRVRARMATAGERALGVVDGWCKPLRFGRRPLLRRAPWADFIAETAQQYLPEAAAFQVRRTTFMKGYWQSPRYFDRIAGELRKELQPPPPDDARMRALGDAMASCDSVAVGVRLYEEDRNPAANARDGRVKPLAAQAAALAELTAHAPSARVFVFCTHRAPALDSLELPRETTFVTEDEGFRGALANLWLMTRCRHHVFNNSSFYWWGAWLAHGRHPLGPGAVRAADNFVNADCIPRGWGTF